MERVGVVGLDTSHAEAFASVLEQRDTIGVTTVWDSGDIRDDDYVAEYCDRFGARQVDAPAEMIDDVDAVMVLAVDWDAHCELARPFLDAGVATLVDKPIAGRMADVDDIEDAADGVPFVGGSAVPYHPAFDDFCRDTSSQAIYCAGYDDPFYYGAHLVDTVRHVAGADWTRVRPASDPGVAVDVEFENDTFATLRFDGPDEDGEFAFLGVADEATTTVVGSSSDERYTMYENYMDVFVDVVAGRVDVAGTVFDAARLLVAVHTALTEHRDVDPDSASIRDTHVRGTSFAETYDPYY